MLSFQVTEQIHALLQAMPRGGPLDAALGGFVAVYREALPKGGPPLETEQPQELIDRTRPWREAVALTFGEIRRLSVSEIFDALRTLREALSAFLAVNGPGLVTLRDDMT